MATTVKSASAALAVLIITGWGQPPPAGSVLFPIDRGVTGYGIARNPSIARQQALEDASANRFLSVRFETFMQGMSYAYSFDEFAIEDPDFKPDQIIVVDSSRGDDRLIRMIVAYRDATSERQDSSLEWTTRGAYRSIVGDEYRAYALAKRQAVRNLLEARFRSVRVMDEATAERMSRVAYISTKAIVRNIRVLEVNHRADSTVVHISIHPQDVTFYE